jgi:hypothetical protein
MNVRVGVVLSKRGRDCPKDIPVSERKDKMKNAFARLLALAVVVVAFGSVRSGHAQIVSGFDDITFWVGTGTNQAGLIIDFHDGQTRQSFAWGYRWNGTASGADMLLAVVAADSELSITSSGFGASGFYLTEISYLEGMNLHSEASGSFATFPTDYNSWGYYIVGGTALGSSVSGGGVTLPTTWTVSPSGASADSFGSPGRILDNHSWDGWSFGQNNPSYEHLASPSSTVFAAVPEPRLLPALALALAILVYARKRIYAS